MLNLMDVMKVTNLNALKKEDGGEDIDAEAAQAFGFLFAQLVMADSDPAKMEPSTADGVVLDVDSKTSSPDQAVAGAIEAALDDIETDETEFSQNPDDGVQPIFDSMDYQSKMNVQTTSSSSERLSETQHTSPTMRMDSASDGLNLEQVDQAVDVNGQTKPDELLKPAEKTPQPSTSPSILETMIQAHVAASKKKELDLKLPDVESKPALTEAAPTTAPQAPKEAALPETGHEITLQTDVAKPDWSSKFNQQIMWFGQQKIDKATLHLHPQELGPLQVQLKMDNDKASLIVHADSQHVRHLIEQGLPQLKDNFLQQGIELHQVHIESNHSNHSNERQAREQDPVLLNSGYEEELGQEQVVMVRQSQGLVDYFA